MRNSQCSFILDHQRIYCRYSILPSPSDFNFAAVLCLANISAPDKLIIHSSMQPFQLHSLMQDECMNVSENKKINTLAIDVKLLFTFSSCKLRCPSIYVFCSYCSFVPGQTFWSVPITNFNSLTNFEGCMSLSLSLVLWTHFADHGCGNHPLGWSDIQ